MKNIIGKQNQWLFSLKVCSPMPCAWYFFSIFLSPHTCAPGVRGTIEAVCFVKDLAMDFEAVLFYYGG